MPTCSAEILRGLDQRVTASIADGTGAYHADRHREPDPTAPTTGASRDQDAAHGGVTMLRVRNERLGAALGELLAAARVARVGERWAIAGVPIPSAP